MSGTARAAASALVVADLAAHFFNSTVPAGTSIGVVFSQWVNVGAPNATVAFPTFIGAASYTNTNAAGTKPPPVAHAASDDADALNFGSTWFEHVHIVPRAKIEFGNILTQEEATFEIYSAYRTASVTLLSIVNNAAPGVELPDTLTPVVVPPQTSILRSTTTSNTDSDTALGTIVLTRVQALQDGLPTFDTDITFDFDDPANSVELLVSGTRIILMPFRYEVGLKEALGWLTDIIEARSGKEQRIALRKNPRQVLDVEFRLQDSQRQLMQALLFDWIGQPFGLPLWHEELRLTAAASIGAMTYQVKGALDVDFRVGGLGVVITDEHTFDVLNLDAVTDTLITAADPSLNAYPVGTPIMPLRTAFVASPVPTQRSLVTLETFRLKFETIDNNTGALQGDTGTPRFWSIYNGRVLFDNCNVVGGNTQTTIRRRIHRIDNQTGKVTLSSLWDRSKRESMRGFLCRSRAETKQLRRVLLAIFGRQKAFYAPSDIEDLTPVATLSSGTATLDVATIDYTRFVQQRGGMNIFRIEFTDGTTLVREVLSSVKLSATVDRLTLDTTWPSTKTVGQVVRIEFYDLLRFDSDELRIDHPQVDIARLDAPVVRVFDDD